MSAVVAWLIFGGRVAIPIAGWDGIAFDAALQSAVIAFLTFFIATRRFGVLAPGWLAVAVARSGAIALCVALIGCALTWAVLGAVAPPRWTAPAVVIYKTVYAVCLGIVLTGPALRMAARTHDPRA